MRITLLGPCFKTGPKRDASPGEARPYPGLKDSPAALYTAAVGPPEGP